VMTAVLGGLGAAGITPEDVAVRRPTLDEVFMELTGHRTDESEAASVGIGAEKEAAA
jgi:ABC-2 type transport system ATP-binding protein